MSLADSSDFLRIVERLILAKPGETPATIQAGLGLKRANFYRVLKFFKFHGAASYGRAELVVNKRKALSLAAGLRADRAVPNTIIDHGPTIDQAVTILQSERVPFALAFQSAANNHGYFEPTGATSLYVETDLRRHAVDVLNERGDRPIHLHAERLERVPTEALPDGSRITTLVQTLLDLLSTPGAGAHAAFLQEVLVRRGTL